MSCATSFEVCKGSLGKFCSMQCQRDIERKEKDDIALANLDDLTTAYKAPAAIKKFLLRHRPHQCEACGITEWQGQPAPLVMDHINGHSDNNAWSNLQLVCGNCDMQLPTYKSKNKNKANGRASRRQRYTEGKSY